MSIDDEHIDRFNKARSFLYFCGYLTEAENKKVKARFIAAAKKEGKRLESKPIVQMKP